MERDLVIEECLKKNREFEEKLDEATRVLESRLDLIRSRIGEIREVICMPMKGNKKTSSFEKKIQSVSEWNLANDANGCPPNADTVTKLLETGYSTYSEQLKYEKAITWTSAQNRSLCSIIHRMEVQERVKEYSEKKCAIKTTANKQEIEALENDIADFDLDALRNKSLEELVLTGKGNYDWEKVSKLLLLQHSPAECKARWYHYLHPSINTASWTYEEDLRLAAIAEAHGEQDWDAIAAELGNGRSAYSCFTAYQSRLRGMDLVAAASKADRRRSSDRAFGRHDGGWTRNDDCALASAVTRSQGVNGITWSQVMQAFPSKSRQQLFARWSQVLDPTLRRGQLSLVEQKAIVIGTRRFGLDFGRIRNELIPHRTVSQLRHFTLYRINKCSGRGLWTVFAQHIFRALIEFLGPGNWRKVRSHFPYNSVSQIKLRYKRQRNMESVRNGTVYIMTKKLREKADETDLETCRLVDLLEETQPLRLCTGVPSASNQPELDINILPVVCEVEVECDTEQSDPLTLDPSTSPQASLNPSLAEIRICDSNESEGTTDSDASESIAVPFGPKPRLGRPPSKKKKVEQTKPKRRYVRSGKFKIKIDENLAPKRTLRFKS